MPVATEGALSFNEEFVVMTDAALQRAQGQAPTAPAFPLVFRLRGSWSSGLLEESLRALAARHSVLRTSFIATTRYSPSLVDMLLRTFYVRRVFIPGTFVRETAACAEVPVVESDADEASVDDLVVSAMANPLTPGKPLVRGVVFHVDPRTHVFVLMASHVVCDGWSMNVLVRDFVATYRARLTGQASSLPALRGDYGEFAAAQHVDYRSGAFAAATDFWREQWLGLNGAAIRYAELPFARQDVPTEEPQRMACASLWFTAEESAAIGQTARTLRVTPYILFRAAMTLALSETLGKRRIAFWANFANRRAGLEDLVGWFSNTHIVTVDVPDTGTLAALCRQVAAAVRDAQRHAALPLAALWQRVGANLDPHDTRVNFDVWPRRVSAAADSDEPIEILAHSWLINMDLDVRLMEDGWRFGLRTTYNGRRYDAAGVSGLVSRIAAIVRRVVEDPSERIAASLTWARR